MPALTIMVGPLLESLARRPQWIPRLVTAVVVLVSFVTQLLSSLTENVRHAEGLLFPLLKAITPPTDGPVIPSVLVDSRWLPQLRLLGLVDRGEWDTLWLVGDRPDVVLLIVLLGCALSAVMWLLAAMQRRAISGALVCQAVLSTALMVWLGIRYPYAPATFQNEPGFHPAEFDHLSATTMSVAVPGDGIVVLLPYGYLQWIDAFIPTAPDYGLPLENPLVPNTSRLLETASTEHDRLWLVSEIAPYDPQDGVEPWLAEHGFTGKSTWFGEYRLESFTFPASELRLDQSPRTFGHEHIALLGHAVGQGREWLNVWLRWQALADGDSDYSATVQLLDTAGVLVAQHDGIPGGGYAPTSAWSAGQIIDDRHSVALPGDLSPGSYRLVVALYGLDGVRLLVSGEPEDAVELTTIDLVPAE
jgi:hypothetical protein